MNLFSYPWHRVQWCKKKKKNWKPCLPFSSLVWGQVWVLMVTACAEQSLGGGPSSWMVGLPSPSGLNWFHPVPLLEVASVRLSDHGITFPPKPGPRPSCVIVIPVLHRAWHFSPSLCEIKSLKFREIDVFLGLQFRLHNPYSYHLRTQPWITHKTQN